jgi:acyl carrier protein
LAFAPDFSIASAKLSSNEEMSVTATFDKVADIIAETSEIDRDSITTESHTIDDLGIDSLDFLDIVFAVDKEFGIKIPLEQWTQEVNDGKASTEEYFVLGNLCAKIDELRAAKG